MQGCSEIGSQTRIFSLQCVVVQLTKVEVHTARLDYFLTAHVLDADGQTLDHAFIRVHSLSTEKPTLAADS